MKFWLLFAGAAVGASLTAVAGAAGVYWWFFCDGWSFC